MPRVCLVYEPLVYAEAIAHFLRGLPSVEIVNRPSAEVDVVVLPLDDQGRPRLDLLTEPAPQAKHIALSPRGDRGLRRAAGQAVWEEIRPFGLALLCVEVHAGRGPVAAGRPGEAGM